MGEECEACVRLRDVDRGVYERRPLQSFAMEAGRVSRFREGERA